MTNPSGPPETPTERGDSKRNSSGKPNSWATSSFPLNPRLHNELVYPDSSLEAPPCFRFHTPLIEPDVRICRIRLSEKTHAIAVAIACDAACDFLKQLGSYQAHRQSPFRRRFLRPPSTGAPSLHRRYPASPVLRAPPPSQSARPFSHELPVDPHCDHRWDFPCCVWSPVLTCRRFLPRQDGWNLFARTIPSTAAFPETAAGRLLH